MKPLAAAHLEKIGSTAMIFDGQSVIITGAAGGIGSALTRGFLCRGARVFATGRKQKQIEDLKDELGAPANLFTAAFDVSDEAGCKGFSRRVREEWRVVDVLVNCAGRFPFTAFEKISYAEWRKICAINLDGPFLVTKNLLPLIRKSRAGASLISVLGAYTWEILTNATMLPPKRD